MLPEKAATLSNSLFVFFVTIIYGFKVLPTADAGDRQDIQEVVVFDGYDIRPVNRGGDEYSTNDLVSPSSEETKGENESLREHLRSLCNANFSWTHTPNVGSTLHIEGYQDAFQPWRKNKNIIIYKYAPGSNLGHILAFGGIINQLNYHLRKFDLFQFEQAVAGQDADFKVNFNAGGQCHVSGIGRWYDNVLYVAGDHCLTLRLVTHELFHMLGYAHTMNCLNRDQSMEILTQNIKEGFEGVYRKSTPCFSVPELRSVMTYDAYYGSKNGLPVILDPVTQEPQGGSTLPTLKDMEQLWIATQCPQTYYDWTEYAPVPTTHDTAEDADLEYGGDNTVPYDPDNFRTWWDPRH